MTLDIGWDWDDVVVPWYPQAVQVCRDAGICPVGVNPVTWNMHEEMGVDLETWVEVINEATRSGILYNAEPDVEALASMWNLHFLGHNVHVVTARGTFPNNPLNPHIQSITKAQVERFTPYVDSLTFTRDKTVVRCDFFLDDNVRNFEALREAGVQAYLLTRPWNADHQTEHRVETPIQFHNIIINWENAHA